MCQACICGFKFSKTVEVGWSCQDLQLCQHKIANDEIQERKMREHSNIKSASVSALMGSVPRKMAEGLQRVSAHCGNQTQVARLSTTHLNHYAIGSYQLSEKNCT